MTTTDAEARALSAERMLKIAQESIDSLHAEIQRARAVAGDDAQTRAALALAVEGLNAILKDRDADAREIARGTLTRVGGERGFDLLAGFDRLYGQSDGWISLTIRFGRGNDVDEVEALIEQEQNGGSVRCLAQERAPDMRSALHAAYVEARERTEGSDAG